MKWIQKIHHVLMCETSSYNQTVSRVAGTITRRAITTPQECGCSCGQYSVRKNDGVFLKLLCKSTEEYSPPKKLRKVSHLFEKEPDKSLYSLIVRHSFSAGRGFASPAEKTSFLQGCQNYRNVLLHLTILFRM